MTGIRLDLPDHSCIAAVAAKLEVPPLAVVLTLAGLAVTRVCDRDEMVIGCPMDERVGAAGLVRSVRFAVSPVNLLAGAIRATADALLRAPVKTPCEAILRWPHAASPGAAVLSFTVAPTAPAQAFATAFGCLLDACAVSLDTPVAALAIVPPAHVAALLAAAAGRKVALPEAPSLPALIESQAARTPSAIAVEDAVDVLDYRGLLTRSTALAGALAERGIKRGDIVALALPRNVSLVVALLAVQQAGAAFLPLDTSYPHERLAFMLRDAGAAVVLATQALDADVPVLRLDAPWPAAQGRPVAAGPDDLAYVLYTSGSTGQPKAVEVTQRSIANLALWSAAMLGPEACTGVLFSTALVFDVAMFELFSPLVSGGRVLVVDNLPALLSSRLRGEVRVVSSSPTVLDAVLRAGGLPATVRCVVPAGEALSRDLADRLFAALPGLRLVNAYGPTEATVYASTAEIDQATRETPPIGRAIANMALYLLDRAGRLVPEGVTGELCLGGVGVARGYLNRPGLTAERFIANPFGPGRLYRTGDRARLRPDGQIEFLGRADGQLKLHGVRIEPEEVEAALRQLPGVAAAVVGADGAGAARRLVGWIVPDAQRPAPTVTDLRRGLAALLPRPMIPTAFVSLPALPVTLSGKLDRAALPAPASEDSNHNARLPPATPVQQALFDLWRDVLDIPAIRSGAFGVDDDLFDVGGDSLAAVLVSAGIESVFGTRIPEEVLAQGMSVARLAAFLETPAAGLGLCLLVDGRRIEPEVLGPRHFVFRVKLPAETVRLLSHAAVPRQVGTADDDRMLGVQIVSLTWEQGERRETLPLAAPLLGEGFHAVERTGARWTNGDAWLAGDLIPAWQGEALLRLHAWVWQTQAPAAAPSQQNAWLAGFESLGDSCEFGFLQKHFDVRQPLGLLRWASTDHRRLLAGFVDGFIGLTKPERIQIILGAPDDRLATPYADLHTFQSMTGSAPARIAVIHQRAMGALSFLRLQLLRDIAEGRKIFVFKTEAADFDGVATRRLHAALRRHGPAALLCVTLAGDRDVAGEVTRLEPGLYAARVSRFVLADGPYDEWLSICRQTLRLHHEQLLYVFMC
jgi:amino acid adenylation domain-containing protein